MAKADEERESALWKEIEDFKREKERIRGIVGKIGGVPTFKKKLLNMLFIVAIMSCFAVPFIFKGWHLPMIEFGIVLISLKIIFLLHNNSRQMHFMFWMLSSLEWRLNEITKEIKANKQQSGG